MWPIHVPMLDSYIRPKWWHRHIIEYRHSCYPIRLGGGGAMSFLLAISCLLWRSDVNWMEQHGMVGVGVLLFRGGGWGSPNYSGFPHPKRLWKEKEKVKSGMKSWKVGDAPSYHNMMGGWGVSLISLLISHPLGPSFLDLFTNQIIVLYIVGDVSLNSFTIS